MPSEYKTEKGIVKGEVDNFPLDRFISSSCSYYPTIPIPEGFIRLYRGVVNVGGYGTGRGGGSDACIGRGVCFSWFCTDYNDFSTCMYTDVKIPLRISQFEEVAKGFVKELKQSVEVRRDLKQLETKLNKEISAGLSKSQKMEKSEKLDESMKAGEKQEQDITLRFFDFIARGLILFTGLGESVEGLYYAADDALQMIMKAYHQDKVEPLIKAYFTYKTLNPEDVELTGEPLDINVAKYIYAKYKTIIKDERDRDIWNVALLNVAFSYLDEFKTVRENLIQEYRNAYQKYSLMARPGLSTLDVAKVDRDLAYRKYLVDMSINDKAKQEDIKDKYLMATVMPQLLVDVSNAAVADFEQALKNQTEKATKVMIKESKKRYVKYALGVLGIILVIGIVRFLKNKKSKINE